MITKRQILINIKKAQNEVDNILLKMSDKEITDRIQTSWSGLNPTGDIQEYKAILIKGIIYDLFDPDSRKR